MIALDRVLEETLTVIFMIGLVDEICEELRLFHPKTLEETMEKVVEVERKNTVIEGKQIT